MPRDFGRREFIAATALAASAGFAHWLSGADVSPTSRHWRAAIIGDTGHGNYGHEWDIVFQGVPDVEVVSVSDPDPTGRTRAAQRSNARKQYADFREMLHNERPELVVIAPRWTIRHHEMAMAALEVGAHLLLEKPFTTTLAEGDEILAAALSARRKIAVGHQMRLAPSILQLQRALHDGLIGELQQIRSWGKQDARAGGEDMMVLGVHLFDLIRCLAGDALWCSARVLNKGREITRADARRSNDDVGPIAGDDVEAQFGFGNGIVATFTSRAALRQTLGAWGMELTGSKGVVRIRTEIVSTVLVRHTKPSQDQTVTDEWQPLPTDSTIHYTAAERSFGPANRRLLDDWLDAITHDCESQCSGANGLKALEMVMSIYESALKRTRITLPLERRTHPLF